MTQNVDQISNRWSNLLHKLDLDDITVPEFDTLLTENARVILGHRYILKGSNLDPLEDEKGLFVRLAARIAKGDDGYFDVQSSFEEFLSMLSELRFLPNSPTIMNAGKSMILGKEGKEQLSACFVLPVEDSLPAIYDSLKWQAVIHQSGGGTGFSFNRLRAQGSTVSTSGGIASGPVSFMKVFNHSTGQIKQGGTRRGANMGILRVDHPDIRTFITCKNDLTQVTNFNISVALTEKFMEAVINNDTYDIIDPSNNNVVRQESASEIYNMIVDSAWMTGEPGIIFIDRINEDNPTPHLGDIEATNPCGEQPLLPFDSCNLGSINLSRHLKDGDEGVEIDWKLLESTVRTAVRYLDNVVTISEFPIPEIREMVSRIRRIGLGVMGWADFLIELGIPYNSQAARDLASDLIQRMKSIAVNESCNLAEKKGAFPEWEKSRFNDNLEPGRPRRNGAILTIAPTGTISILAGCSGGIEPLFALAFFRRHQDGEINLVDVNEKFVETAKAHGFWSDRFGEALAHVGTIKLCDEVISKLNNGGYSDMIPVFQDIPQHVVNVWVTAHDCTPSDHLQMQAAFQSSIENAVSKTVNFPESATKRDVSKVYLDAYKLGCKGVTVYRDGSRQGQVLSTGSTRKESDADASISHSLKNEYVNENATELPRVSPAIRTTMKTEQGTIHMTTTFTKSQEDDTKLRISEIFLSLGQRADISSQYAETLGRMISIMLRSNIPIAEIIGQLRKVAGKVFVVGEPWGGFINGPAEAVARMLEEIQHRLDHNLIHMDIGAGTPVFGRYNKNQTIADISSSKEESIPVNDTTSGKAKKSCIACGGEMIFAEGCDICVNCGESKCS